MEKNNIKSEKRDSKEKKDFLTPRGRALVERCKRERELGIKEEWYSRYLSDSFKANQRAQQAKQKTVEGTENEEDVDE